MDRQGFCERMPGVASDSPEGRTCVKFPFSAPLAFEFSRHASRTGGPSEHGSADMRERLPRVRKTGRVWKMGGRVRKRGHCPRLP